MLVSLFSSGLPLYLLVILALALIGSAVLSMVLHEYAHGFVALKCGDTTAKKRGRLTFNPLAHFDWVGLALMLIVGFGWAKPVPINPNNFKKRKLGICLVSLAGICANLVLAAISLLVLYLFFTYFEALCLLGGVAAIFGYLLIYFFEYLVILNIMLAFFNILPICPLDGFRFVDSLLPSANKFSTFMYKYGNYCLIGFVALCYLLEIFGLKQFSVFYQVQQLAHALIDLCIGG